MKKVIKNESASESYRRKMACRRSPTENVRLFYQLQTQAFEILASSPDAMRHFIARNHHKRRRSEVAKILRSHGRSEAE